MAFSRYLRKKAGSMVFFRVLNITLLLCDYSQTLKQSYHRTYFACDKVCRKRKGNWCELKAAAFITEYVLLLANATLPGKEA